MPVRHLLINKNRLSSQVEPSGSPHSGEKLDISHKLGKGNIRLPRNRITNVEIASERLPPYLSPSGGLQYWLIPEELYNTGIILQRKKPPLKSTVL